MYNQLSLFNNYIDNRHWEHPIVNGVPYTLLDIVYPKEIDYCAYFQMYFDTNVDIFAKLLNSKEIWIKPNITNIEKWERGKTSNPYVLSALLDFLQKYHKKKDIYVADSSVIGCDTRKAAEECGILSICNDKGITFVDIRDLNFKDITVKNSLIYNTIDIAEPFSVSDTFKINLGKIKSTYGSPVGFTIKNAKGIIRDELKIQFHKRGVQKAICDLFECIDWDLAILEGLPMSELGQPKDNGPIIISDSVLICDYYEASMLHVISEYDRNSPFHLNILSERYGINNNTFSSIFRERQILTDQRLSFCLHGIEQLEEDYCISIHDGKPCSGCLESFSKAIMRMEPDSIKELKTIFVLGAEGELHGEKEHTLIGTCAIDNLTMLGFNNNNIQDNDKELIKLDKKIKSSFPTPGCPPTIDSINETINELCKKFGVLNSRDKYNAFEISFPSLFNLNLPTIYKRLNKIIPKENILFDIFDLELSIACEVICATICHQMNWDYLRNAVLEKTTKLPIWVNSEYLSSIKQIEVQDLFSNYGKQHRVRADERKKLLNNLGISLKNVENKYSNIFFNEIGELKKSEEILNFFNGCAAFSDDPERKKIQILLQSLSKYPALSKLIEYSNPAIDYHIIRNYLRRGLVFPLTNFTKTLLYDWNVKSERTIGILRSFCSEAMRKISLASDISINKVNNIDWWIGRSVCLHDEPDCLLINDDSYWLKTEFSKCPFYYYCDAIRDNKLLTINEPNYFGSSY
jgi:uncharacterized protein (DUF362 family)